MIIPFIAQRTAEKLGSLVKKDGKFIYAYDAGTLFQEDIEYNLLRHAGSVWALNLACKRFQDDQLLRAVAHRSLNWLLNSSVYRSPFEGMCVASDGVAKLGGTALALLALMTTCDGNHEVDEQSRSQMARGFCLHILRSIAGGKSKDKIRARDGVELVFSSAYYLGQALLALVLAREYLSDDERSTLASNIMRKVDEGYGISEQSHWMAYAVCEAYRWLGDAILTEYLRKIVENILQNTNYRGKRCTPIACRTEAMACAGSILDVTDGDLSVRLKQAVKENLLMQFKDLQPDGAFVSGTSRRVRIDFLQHNLGSFLLAEKLKIRIG